MKPKIINFEEETIERLEKEENSSALIRRLVDDYYNKENNYSLKKLKEELGIINIKIKTFTERRMEIEEFIKKEELRIKNITKEEKALLKYREAKVLWDKERTKIIDDYNNQVINKEEFNVRIKDLNLKRPKIEEFKK